ncbi:N-acetylmuramoyl-L-alanine amidase [Rarobacter incanus]|nr:N-acetylmuramoyl-L-alanine amidase [Rarobacter incanus]
MRRFTSLLSTFILTAGALAVPVAVLPRTIAQNAEPTITTKAIAGIDSRASKDPLALAAVSEESADLAPDAAPEQAGRLTALTAQVQTGNFMVAGVTWDGAAEVTQVALRLRENESWGSWTNLPVSDDDSDTSGGADPARHGTEPLTSAGATGYQVRVMTADGIAPSNLQIELIDPHVTQADAAVVADATGAAAQAADSRDVLQPQVITRSQWGANEKLGGAWNATSNGVKSIYIHHTAGANSYTEAQAPALVRGIYTYHTSGMKWADIGYQFLVDKFGNIYQGRRTAVYDTPIGAQAGGYNTGTIGISAMGNYETVQPTSALMTSITRVVAWKAYQYGIDPTAKTKLTTGTSSKSTTRAAFGQKVTVRTVQGHRDTNYTSCPGKYLYTKLAQIRSDAKELMDEATISSGTPIDDAPAPVGISASAATTPVQWAASATYKWKPVTGASSYQIVTQGSSSYRSGYPSNSTWTVYKSVKGTSASVKIASTATKVIGVRAIDKDGRRGPIRVLATSSRPVLAGSILRSSGWKKVKSSKYWGKSALRSTSAGRTLRVKSIKSARYVVLRGVRGAGAGTVRVSLGGWSKTVNLASGTASKKASIVIKLDKARSGTLTIKTLSKKKVYISGIGLGRTKRATVAARLAIPTAPAAAVVPAAGYLRSGKQTVSWPASAGATSYVVYVRRLTAKGTELGSWQSSSTTKKQAEIALDPGEFAQVAVLARNAQGTSAAAQIVSVARSVDLSLATLSGGWSVSPGADGTLVLGSKSAAGTAQLPTTAGVTGLAIEYADTPESGDGAEPGADATATRQGVVTVRDTKGRLALVDVGSQGGDGPGTITFSRPAVGAVSLTTDADAIVSLRAVAPLR